MANTNKDYAKLKEVSDLFTEETLKDILYKVHNGKEINVLRWDFAQMNATGDNYLSTVYKIKVTGTVDGQEVHVNLVVKAMPKNIGRRNTFRSAEFFHNEIEFYTKVISKFEEFVKEKGQMQVLCIPRHLASVTDGENDYIAMEDVTFLGYKPISRQNFIDEDQCKTILKAIARFHAISFAYKDQKKEEFMEMVGNLHETYYTLEHWNWYKRFLENIVNINKNALALECKNAVEFCDCKYQLTSVVTQGDCWLPNFLAKETKENEAVMLDFQLARCSSPILDLATFVYACTDKTMWDTQFDMLLKFYYDELSKTITLLGSNPENVYSWNTFMNEVKEKFVFGMIFTMEITPMCLLDDSDAFDLDLIKGDKAVDISDVWTLLNVKSQSGRLRLTNIIEHAVQKGFFK
ncbi:hypothetical protein WH47_02679 [Habropoda laboriosa]|uniref:CHK kinase-like domain-containing protein n=1 Tax=Habropoda laboriosa TaxID=597456 RepID=A0A0L7QX48_9HYME|nr:PREDICTED: uncharacterized protein LOC108574204 [Habropoda laboriosa]KOC63170.1 hypothetical protein WH47_02679 [Habropoda laboriosa]